MAVKTHTDKKTTKCKPKTCPTCGGVECFDRPRFFCGQLLTDKDLDAAQRYVIEKNKLHNRHIVGTGVVCGLPVRCDPCDGIVVIEPGYAIDCCGNDIVVCESYEFDVIDYLEKCFRKDDPGCEGKIRPPRVRCDDRAREYCLIISYIEEPARPVTALVRNNGCSTKKCEPSRTKEGFRVDLIVKEPEDKDKPGDDFWSHAAKCLAEFLRITRKFFADLSQATNNQNPDAQYSEMLGILCRLEDDILKLYKKGPNVRCTIAEELSVIESSFPTSRNDPQYAAKVYHALFSMFGRLLQFLIDCICDALLVPCSECGEEEGVLLACLTVNGGKIEKICNIVRKQVLTGPALHYWFQPICTAIHKVLEHICCELNLGAVFDRLFLPRQTDNALGLSALNLGGTTGFAMGQSVQTAFARSESAFKLGRDFSTAALRSIRTANLLQFTNPNVVTAMDVYGVPMSEAAASLTKKGVIVSGMRVANDDTEAYKLEHLQNMTWVVPPGSIVELVAAPDNRVTAIRVIEGT